MLKRMVTLSLVRFNKLTFLRLMHRSIVFSFFPMNRFSSVPVQAISPSTVACILSKAMWASQDPIPPNPLARAEN